MDNIRITSGVLRGRTIKSPRSNLTHPMGAREKIALFNMISTYLPGARVLDAFAGSGALGIEVLSRGAKEVWFVEKNAKAIKVIKENLASLGLTNRGKVVCQDVKKYQTEEKFSLIIADPPYDDFKIEDVEGLVGFLEESGAFILSHPGEAPELSGMKLQKTHSYAAANISIYVRDLTI